MKNKRIFNDNDIVCSRVIFLYVVFVWTKKRNGRYPTKVSPISFVERKTRLKLATLSLEG